MKDIDSLSKNDLLKKYLSTIVSGNPAELAKLLQVEGFDFLHNKNPNAYSYSSPQMETIYNFLRLLADTHRYINATDNAEALTKNEAFTPKTYGDIPPKMTIGNYIDYIKKNFAEADAKDAKRTKKT
jgi:hypothetical protein